MTRRVVIIGGGAIGQAAAAFTLAIDPQARVTVIERDITYAMASSALSASSIRVQFSTATNIALSRFSYGFMERLQLELGNDALGLRPCGYMFVAEDEVQARRLEARAEIVTASGGMVCRHDTEDLARIYPWLSADGLICAYEGMAEEGWFDGYSLLQAMRNEARARGASLLKGEASAVLAAGDRVAGVRLASGDVIEADQVLIAAGAWTREIGATAGLDLPIFRRRRSVFAFDCPVKIPNLPILVEPSGIYVRRDGDSYLTVASPEPENDPDDLALDPDFDLFESHIWPRLAERIPAFEQLRVTRAWAGYYEFNPIDHNGLIGAAGLEGLFVAAGFSGHGLMHCPGVGRGIAEVMASGRYSTIDLEALRPSRFAEGTPVHEEAIV